jgi:pimeloyl-ACP methyl ester carboxylesterase
MGGFTALHLGLKHPHRTMSLTLAGTGYGAERHLEADFRAACIAVAETFETEGAAVFASAYAEGASRVQFLAKDPRGWQEFAYRLATHSDFGSALTMRGVQAHRESLWNMETDLRQLRLPVLILVGDEDDHCLQPGLFLKRTIPTAGHRVVARRPGVHG